MVAVVGQPYSFAEPIVTAAGERFALVSYFTDFPIQPSESLKLQLVDFSAPTTPKIYPVNSATPWLGGSGVQVTIIRNGIFRTSRFNQPEPVVVADKQGRLTMIWEQPTQLATVPVENMRATLHVRRLE